MPRQADLAQASEMLQSRISLIETPGAANVTLDTLSRIAAAFKVGLIVKFVPFSEMLAWENNFSQDQFDVVKIDKDTAFLSPTPFVQTIELVLTAPYQWEPSGLTHGQNAFSPEIVRTYCNPTVLWDATTETVAQYSHVN
jgi:transcriptional regulator with XRE-family HTH domain